MIPITISNILNSSESSMAFSLFLLIFLKNSKEILILSLNSLNFSCDGLWKWSKMAEFISKQSIKESFSWFFIEFRIFSFKHTFKNSLQIDPSHFPTKSHCFSLFSLHFLSKTGIYSMKNSRNYQLKPKIFRNPWKTGISSNIRAILTPERSDFLGHLNHQSFVLGF